MKKYAIEIIGYGKKRRYAIKSVGWNYINPIKACWGTFRTEDDARAAAADAGIEITAVGDLYTILAAYRE